MSRTLDSKSVILAGAVLLTAACGGGGGGDDDAPRVDSGMVGDAGPDAGPVRPWPVPSDFPPDGPMQPGEGDPCRLSVQCTDHRQICVDDACTREERVRAEDLTVGEWRTLTPDSTDENPFASIESLSAFSRVVLDEDGEVGFVGFARDTTGRTIFFSVGQDLRMIRPSEGDGGLSVLPFQGGFLVDRGPLEGVVFYAADGTAEWTATPRTTALSPYESGIVGYVHRMIHTPSGPVLVAVSALNTDLVFDIIDMQRLDLEEHRFADIPFVDGPFMTGASIGQPVMGPTGLELILGRAVGDAQPELSVYTVATGEERPIGGGTPSSWGIDVSALAADEWVGILSLYDLPAGACAFAAIGASGAEITRITEEEATCGFYRPARPNSAEPDDPELRYVKSATRSAWVRNGEDSLDGVVWSRSEWGMVRSSIAASRYAKTFEIIGRAPVVGLGAAPGVYVAERQLQSVRGGL